MDTFTQAYVECALWSSTDHNDEPLDGGEYELAKTFGQCDLYVGDDGLVYSF